METHDLNKTYGFIKWKDSRTSYDPNEISSKTQIPKKDKKQQDKDIKNPTQNWK